MYAPWSGVSRISSRPALPASLLPMMGLRGVHSEQGPTWEGAQTEPSLALGGGGCWGLRSHSPRPPSSSAQNVTGTRRECLQALATPCLWPASGVQQLWRPCAPEVGPGQTGVSPVLAAFCFLSPLRFSSEKKWNLEREGRKKEGKKEGRREEDWVIHKRSILSGLDSQPPTVWLYIKDTSSNTNKILRTGLPVLERPQELHGRGDETGAEGVVEADNTRFSNKRPKEICHLQSWTQESCSDWRETLALGTQIFQKDETEMIKILGKYY